MSLDFVIAVRHHLTVTDWTPVGDVISQTADSIAAQAGGVWRAVFVANTQTPMPRMPRGIEVCRVDLEPPHLPDPRVDQDAYFEAIRRDKGRRLLAGVDYLAPTGHIMAVDYDDFVSNRLAKFVSDHSDRDGWVLNSGYLVERPGKLAFLKKEGFNDVCGSSLIIAARHYRELLESQGEERLRLASRWLGSHKFIRGDLRGRGVSLENLPFRGAAWRLAGPGETSGKRTVLKEVANFGGPRDAIRRVAALRPVSANFRAEYFAE